MHRTEIERAFLAAKNFNTNLEKLLTLYYVIISNVHVCFYVHNFPRARTCTENDFACAKSSAQKIMIYEDLEFVVKTVCH